jgi:hypothetical protein
VKGSERAVRALIDSLCAGAPTKNVGPRRRSRAACTVSVQRAPLSPADVDMMNCRTIIHRGLNIMHVAGGRRRAGFAANASRQTAYCVCLNAERAPLLIWVQNDEIRPSPICHTAQLFGDLNFMLAILVQIHHAALWNKFGRRRDECVASNAKILIHNKFLSCERYATYVTLFGLVIYCLC